MDIIIWQLITRYRDVLNLDGVGTEQKSPIIMQMTLQVIVYLEKHEEPSLRYLAG